MLANAPFAVKLRRGTGKSRPLLLLEKLERELGGSQFSAQQAGKLINQSPRNILRLLRAGVEEKKLSRKNARAFARYSFKKG